MGETLSVIKTLIIPAIIALLFFLLITFVLVPMWQRYRNRYSQYLPVETISSGSSLLRQRFQGGVIGAFMPSFLRRRQERVVVATDNGSDADFNSEEGEELEVVHQDRREQNQREAVRPDLERRLSRDLEEGFRDESDDELETAIRTR